MYINFQNILYINLNLEGLRELAMKMRHARWNRQQKKGNSLLPCYQNDFSNGPRLVKTLPNSQWLAEKKCFNYVKGTLSRVGRRSPCQIVQKNIKNMSVKLSEFQCSSSFFMINPFIRRTWIEKQGFGLEKLHWKVEKLHVDMAKDPEQLPWTCAWKTEKTRKLIWSLLLRTCSSIWASASCKQKQGPTETIGTSRRFKCSADPTITEPIRCCHGNSHCHGKNLWSRAWHVFFSSDKKKETKSPKPCDPTCEIQILALAKFGLSKKNWLVQKSNKARQVILAGVFDRSAAENTSRFKNQPHHHVALLSKYPPKPMGIKFKQHRDEFVKLLCLSPHWGPQNK